MNDAQLRTLRRRHWHLLTHRCQIEKPSDYVRIEWFADEIVVFNDQGSILVFDNICPHRGARIFDANDGNQLLRCRYHGWAFRNGRFHVPFPNEFAAEDLARAKYNTFETAWCAGFLFASEDPRTTLEDQLGGVYPLLESVSDSIARSHSLCSFTWQSDWRIALENALEEYHTAVGLIHPGSFGRIKPSDGTNEFFGKNSVYRCEFRATRTVRQLERLRRFFDLKLQYPGYMSIYLFPFAMIGSTYGYSYAIQHFMPGRTNSECHFASRMFESRLQSDANPEILANFFDSSSQLNRQVFDEDHAICRRVSQQSLTPSFTPILAKSETKIRRFRQSVAEALGG
jgi:phenylpropionate dioxygenase-like ring-hydroxylating dioxygenase large terminal subunit